MATVRSAGLVASGCNALLVHPSLEAEVIVTDVPFMIGGKEPDRRYPAPKPR